MREKYPLEELLTVAKRENNPKRGHLYVNPLQGKHIPAPPSRCLALFSALAEMLERHYPGEKLLGIGFAETATAIGAAVACRAENVRWFLTTTREPESGAEKLFFTESHSHAVEQGLILNGMEACLEQADRVVFIEDEVSTGRTVEKLMTAMKDRFGQKVRAFGILSILNSMPPERLEALACRGAECLFLHRMPPQYRGEETANYSYLPLDDTLIRETGIAPRRIREGEAWNARFVTDTGTIRAKTDKFVRQALQSLDWAESPGSVLVLGTEEFMFPAMLLGARLEELYPACRVRFHATTRSPIQVSGDEGYPLKNRVALGSLYEKGRKTFLYNLEQYDRVLLATDAVPPDPEGLASLLGALERRGNREVSLITWGGV